MRKEKSKLNLMDNQKFKMTSKMKLFCSQLVLQSIEKMYFFVKYKQKFSFVCDLYCRNTKN